MRAPPGESRRRDRATTGGRAEIARSALADYDRLQEDALNQGISGVDKFYGVFSREMRPDVEACAEEWAGLMDAIRAAPAESPEALAQRLKALRANNARWLGLAAKQFVAAVDDFHKRAGLRKLTTPSPPRSPPLSRRRSLSEGRPRRAR